MGGHCNDFARKRTPPLFTLSYQFAAPFGSQSPVHSRPNVQILQPQTTTMTDPNVRSAVVDWQRISMVSAQGGRGAVCSREGRARREVRAEPGGWTGMDWVGRISSVQMQGGRGARAGGRAASWGRCAHSVARPGPPPPPPIVRGPAQRQAQAPRHFCGCRQAGQGRARPPGGRRTRLLALALRLVLFARAQADQGNYNPPPMPPMLPRECFSANGVDDGPEKRRAKGEPAQVGARIVGGVNVTARSYPWLVSLQYGPVTGFPGGVDFCGGTLVSPTRVVTAAHCIPEHCDYYSQYYPGVAAPNFHVVFGMDRRLGISTDPCVFPRMVVDVVCNPGFNGCFESPNVNGCENDIAVLTLGSPVPYEFVTALDRPSTTVAPPGADVTVAGWGTTSYGGGQPDVAMQVVVPVWTNADCNSQDSYQGLIELSMICAGATAGGIDSCQGDSGGPLFVPSSDGSAVLVGVVSWGFGCALAGYPGVYTRVSSYVDWVCDAVGLGPSACTPPPPSSPPNPQPPPPSEAPSGAPTFSPTASPTETPSPSQPPGPPSPPPPTPPPTPPPPPTSPPPSPPPPTTPPPTTPPPPTPPPPPTTPPSPPPTPPPPPPISPPPYAPLTFVITAVVGVPVDVVANETLMSLEHKFASAAVGGRNLTADLVVEGETGASVVVEIAVLTLIVVIVPVGTNDTEVATALRLDVCDAEPLSSCTWTVEAYSDGRRVRSRRMSEGTTFVVTQQVNMSSDTSLSAATVNSSNVASIIGVNSSSVDISHGGSQVQASVRVVGQGSASSPAAAQAFDTLANVTGAFADSIGASSSQVQIVVAPTIVSPPMPPPLAPPPAPPPLLPPPPQPPPPSSPPSQSSLGAPSTPGGGDGAASDSDIVVPLLVGVISSIATVFCLVGCWYLRAKRKRCRKAIGPLPSSRAVISGQGKTSEAGDASGGDPRRGCDVGAVSTSSVSLHPEDLGPAPDVLERGVAHPTVASPSPRPHVVDEQMVEATTHQIAPATDERRAREVASGVIEDAEVVRTRAEANRTGAVSTQLDWLRKEESEEV